MAQGSTELEGERQMVELGLGTNPHMRPSDAFSWYMERDPLLRSTVVTVGLLDRAPDRDALRAVFKRATNVVPGLHHVVRVPPLRLATPRWTRTDEVDLDWHLRWVTAASPGELDEVMTVARTRATTAFDPARPLWEFCVVEGLRAGRAAFVMKFHHALTDGIGGMELAPQLFDLARSGTSRSVSSELPGEHLDVPRLALDALAHDLGVVVAKAQQAPGSALRVLGQTMRHPRSSAEGLARASWSVAKTVEPFLTTMSPLMRERRLGRALEMLDVPLEGLNRAAAAVDGHLNDAFLAAVTGGLRIYHQRHAISVKQLRVTMPISLRTKSDGPGGNRLTLARFAVPAGIVDPSERMRAIRRLTDAWRAEPSLALTQGIAVALNLLPSSLVGGMLKHVDFLASNVPGFPIPVYLAGSRLDDYYAFGPTIGSSVNVTLMSYAGTCNIGVSCDTGAIPDVGVFMECLGDGFQEVLDVGETGAKVQLPLRG